MTDEQISAFRVLPVSLVGSDVVEGDFFARLKTAEMAQRIAKRLHKPHGVFSDFAVRWVEAIDALEEELRVDADKHQ